MPSTAENENLKEIKDYLLFRVLDKLKGQEQITLKNVISDHHQITKNHKNVIYRS